MSDTEQTTAETQSTYIPFEQAFGFASETWEGVEDEGGTYLIHPKLYDRDVDASFHVYLAADGDEQREEQRERLYHLLRAVAPDGVIPPIPPAGGRIPIYVEGEEHPLFLLDRVLCDEIRITRENLQHWLMFSEKE